jgi:hypothetical protein
MDHLKAELVRLRELKIFNTPIGRVVRAAFKVVQDEKLDFENGEINSGSPSEEISRACAREGLPKEYFLKLCLSEPEPHRLMPRGYADLAWQALGSHLGSGVGLLAYSPDLPGKVPYLEWAHQYRRLWEIEKLQKEIALIEIIAAELSGLNPDSVESSSKPSGFAGNSSPSTSAVGLRNGPRNLTQHQGSSQSERQIEKRGPSSRGPSMIIHCDWSVDPNKQCLVVAQRSATGFYEVRGPQSVGGMTSKKGNKQSHSPLLDLIAESSSTAAGNAGGLWLGFDFPIGVPSGWAEKAGFRNFRDVLKRLSNDSAKMFEPCTTFNDASADRPFVENLRGEGIQAKWACRIGFPMQDRKLVGLKRVCEVEGGQSLFWLVGANQVGKAALNGWRNILLPLLGIGNENGPGNLPEPSAIKLYPHDLAPNFAFQSDANSVVIFETYPAIAWKMLCKRETYRKTSTSDRKSIGSRIIEWADQLNASLVDGLRAEIESGFDCKNGDDRMDALIGALHMIEVAQSGQLSTPTTGVNLRLEGWILGRDAGSGE